MKGKDAEHLREWLEKGVILIDGEGDSINLDDETPVHVAIAVDVEGYGPHTGAIYTMQNRYHGSADAVLQPAVEVLEEWMLQHQRDYLKELEEEYGDDALDVFTETIDAVTWELTPQEFAAAIKDTAAEKYIKVYSEEGSGLDGTVTEFWDIFEQELAQSVAKNPSDYALRPEEAPEDYARRTRVKMQHTAEAESISRINLDSSTFRRVARRLGVTKFSQRALKEVYAAYGGR
jgi:hypothetical protein